MFRRIALVAIIAGGYAVALYTEAGCAPLESPTQPPLVLGTLRGTVTDAKSGAPIPNATVMTATVALSSTTVLVTDNAGRYLSAIAAGSVTVTVLKAGYQTFTTGIAVTENGTTTLDVQLQPNS